MTRYWTQPSQAGLSCPPSSPRNGTQTDLGDVEPSLSLHNDMMYLRAQLGNISSLSSVDHSSGSRSPQVLHAPLFVPGRSSCHNCESTNPCPRHASLNDDDDATVCDASSPVSSRYSQTETILEIPTTYHDRLEKWDLENPRTSGRSYQELWPSSSTSLANTLPPTLPSENDMAFPAYPFSRKKRARGPQPSAAMAQISPPVFSPSIANAINRLPISRPGAEVIQPWSGIAPCCPHRKVPTPNKEMEISRFDADSDDGEQRAFLRFRRRVSNGFQHLLCRSG